MGAFAVLHLLDRVIEPHVDNLFIADFRAGHVVHQCPSDPAAEGSGGNKPLLRTGVKGIFPVHEFRVEHDVALLRGRLDVGEALPMHEILRPGHTAVATADDRSPGAADGSCRSAQKMP